MIKQRAFVLVTVYSDADRSSLSEIRSVPSVKNVDVVLGAFDAVVTVEGEDETDVEEAVAAISRIQGIKEAKALVEASVPPRRNPRAALGRA